MHRTRLTLVEIKTTISDAFPQMLHHWIMLSIIVTIPACHGWTSRQTKRISNRNYYFSYSQMIEFPNCASGSASVESTFTIAKSEISSGPITFPLSMFPSFNVTLKLFALSTT